MLQYRGQWPCQQVDIDTYYASCPQCQIFSSSHHIQELEELHPLSSCQSFENQGMDFIEMVKIKKGNKWILTLVDHAMKWLVAVLMLIASSQHIVDGLQDHIVLHYGFPHKILSDHSHNFLASIISIFLQKENIKHLTTLVYHPRTNDKVEWYNSILENYLWDMSTIGDKL